MSLPTRAVFYKDGCEIAHAFTNVGWVMDEQNIPSCVKRSASNVGLVRDDWDTVKLYGKEYTVGQIYGEVAEHGQMQRS